MRRVLRVVLVGALILALGVDPATACHFLRSRWGGGGWSAGYCPPPIDYAGPCNGVTIDGDGCCSYQGYGHEEYVGDSCCDGGAVVEYGRVIESGEPVGEGEIHRAAPSEPVPDQSETFKPMDEEPAPMLPPDPMPMRPEAPATDDDLLTPPPQATPPADTTPVETTPPAATPPAAAEEDLFGPETEAVPETEPATPPATEAEPMEDFFNEGPAETIDPGALPPESSPSEPAATPPAGAPATEATEEDLFDEVPAAEPEAPAVETPTTEAPVEAPADENVEESGMDELDTNEQPATPADDGAPATDEAPTTEEEENLFDDFGAILREPGGLSSSEMRQWVDNTGRYSCNARLIRFLDGQVRLLKENGRTTTLPLYRLSANDLQFVHRQASAQQAEVIGQTVQSAAIALPWMAN